jgi:ubiquinone/menaquinone biosynthesis C-methylase UbiE
MNNTDLDKWDAAASAWHSQIAQQDTYRTHLISEALEQLIPSAPGAKILDAGCGNGYFSNWLAQKGGQVTGVDGSTEMVKLAQQTYPKIEFKVHDLLKPLIGDSNQYDLVLANMLLMHISDSSVFFSETRRLLKPSGRLIFSVLHPCFNLPTTKLYKSIWDKIMGRRPNGLATDYYLNQHGRFESHFKTNLTHYHRTLEQYSSELQKAGFSITQILEPHHLPAEFLKDHPKFEYATRLPRFIFFNCKPNE